MKYVFLFRYYFLDITRLAFQFPILKAEYFLKFNKLVSSFRNSCNGVKRNPLKIKESFEPAYLLNNLDNEPCVECTTMNTYTMGSKKRTTKARQVLHYYGFEPRMQFGTHLGTSNTTYKKSRPNRPPLNSERFNEFWSFQNQP